MKRNAILLMLLVFAASTMSQSMIPPLTKPSVKGGITSPSIPVVIRGGTHPSSQSDEAEARFVRTAVLSPSEPDETIHLPFSLGIVATALDADRSVLCQSFYKWTDIDCAVPVMYEDEQILCLSDYGSINYSGGRRGSYWLSSDGQVKTELDGDLLYTFSVDTVTQYLTLDVSQRPGALKEGDICFAEFAFNLKGRIVTFEITITMSSETRGPSIPLAGMEKVGEQVVSATFDLAQPAAGNVLNIDYDAISAMFDGGSEGSAPQLYVMTDYGQMLVSDYYTYHSSIVSLDIEGLETSDYSSGLWYILTYDPWLRRMSVSFDSRAFAGGECGSGSVLLVRGNQYCELVLDLHFGDATDSRTDYDIVDVQPLNVQLMTTSTYYTAMTQQGDPTLYSLVTTPLDMLRIAELIGTETPMLYAEQMNNGAETLTRNYTADPGQGFWFKASEGKAYVSPLATDCCVGVYYSDGVLKWYEVPDVPRVGDVCSLNLYLANPKKGLAVKYEVQVEYVEQIDEATTHAIRRLPVRMTAGRDASAIGNLTPTLSEGEGVVCNLSGQRLNAPQRGLNIVDGKKVFIK